MDRREVDSTQSRALPDPDWASAEAIRAELDVEVEIQAKRADAADSRAGVLLGFSGALAALAMSTKTLLALPGAVMAAIAAVYATRVFWPRVHNTVEPIVLLRTYATKSEAHTKREVLKRRAADYEANKEWVSSKTARLRTAVIMLRTAILLVVGGVGLQLVVDHLMK